MSDRIRKERFERQHGIGFLPTGELDVVSEEVQELARFVGRLDRPDGIETLEQEFDEKWFDYNPHHVQSGPEGGQFTTSGGGSPVGATKEVKGKGGQKAKVAAGLAVIPAAHMERLKGVQIFHFERAKTDTGEEVMGYFRPALQSLDPTEKIYGSIHIAEKFKIGQNYTRSRDITGTTVHEIGHALDFSHNWSKGPKFAQMVKEDAEAGMTRADRNYAEYYFSNDKEMFAEAYRAAYSPSGKAFGMSGAKARRVFARTIAAIREDLG